MVAMPIYGKTFEILFSLTNRPMTLKFDMQHPVFESFQDYSNKDLGLALNILWQGQIWYKY